MKKKQYTRPVSILLTEEMFDQVETITNEKDIGISDYIREAIKDKLENNGSIINLTMP